MSRQIAHFLVVSALLVLVLQPTRLQPSAFAADMLNETQSLNCVLVQAGEFRPGALKGIADITICNLPFHDDAFPVTHRNQPAFEEFEIFIDRSEEPMPSEDPNWQQAMAMIALH